MLGLRELAHGVGTLTSARPTGWVWSRVAGWVRNRGDGTVEAVLEGAAASVEAVLAACADGPRGADVSYVDVSEEEPEGLRGFEVR